MHGSIEGMVQTTLNSTALPLRKGCGAEPDTALQHSKKNF